MNKYEEYIKGVKDGSLIVPIWIKKSVERFETFQTKYDFKADKVNKVIKFISNLKHSTGKHANQPFHLLPYQEYLTAFVFGFYYKGTDKRVTKTVYFSCARKQGKSALISAWALYCLVADGEANAEIDVVASNVKQAKLIFDMASNFCSSIDRKGKYFKRYRDNILFPKTKSKMQVLSSEAKGLDGFNASVAVLDECHQSFTDTALYDVLRSSQGMRENPLFFMCTTCGFNLYGECKRFEDIGKDILLGLKEDDTTQYFIYQLDEDDDWTDENVWIKSNPSLGQTVQIDYIKEQVKSAIQNPSLECGVKTKNINMWVASSDTWLSDKIIQEQSIKVDISEFDECYCGVDLSATCDLTAVSFLFVKGDKYYTKTNYYLPKDTLTRGENAPLYQAWARDGYLKITEGNVVDYDYIVKNLVEVNKKCFINKICYDSWNATQFAINMENLGFGMYPYSQSIGNFNKPTKELARLILGKKLFIDDNPITRFCFQNVVIKTDWNENEKPIKEQRNSKIDGVIAMIQALGAYLINHDTTAEIIPII